MHTALARLVHFRGQIPCRRARDGRPLQHAMCIIAPCEPCSPHNNKCLHHSMFPRRSGAPHPCRPPDPQRGDVMSCRGSPANDPEPYLPASQKQGTYGMGSQVVSKTVGLVEPTTATAVYKCILDNGASSIRTIAHLDNRPATWIQPIPCTGVSATQDSCL